MIHLIAHPYLEDRKHLRTYPSLQAMRPERPRCNSYESRQCTYDEENTLHFFNPLCQFPEVHSTDNSRLGPILYPRFARVPCLPDGELLQPAEQMRSNYGDTFCVQTGIKMGGEEDGTLRWKLSIRIVDQQNDRVLR